LISLSLWRRERVSGSASRALCDALIDFTAARVLVSGFQGFLGSPNRFATN
jgi:hypothetical protein